MAIEIDLKGEHCSECYQGFKPGDGIVFVAKEFEHPDKPNSIELNPVHLRHLLEHSHVQNSITNFVDPR